MNNEARRLIVNADDFGQSQGINRGVSLAHEHGILTSASLMVRWPAAAEAAAYARSHPHLSVGLHVDLGEWRCTETGWVPVYEVTDLKDERRVRADVLGQLETFRACMGRDPTHLDSHQHVHRREPVRSVVQALALQLGVPLRHDSPQIHYCGAFYGQDEKGTSLPGAISPHRLVAMLEGLPVGITELTCHPAVGQDVAGMYGAERSLEVETLVDARIRVALNRLGISLISFQDVALEGLTASGSSVTPDASP